MMSAFPGAASPLTHLDGLGGDLANLLVTGLLAQSPTTRAVLALLTLLDPWEEMGSPVVVGEIVRLPFRVDRLRLGQTSDLLCDPVATLRAEYVNDLQSDDDAAAMADKLFPRIEM